MGDLGFERDLKRRRFEFLKLLGLSVPLPFIL